MLKPEPHREQSMRRIVGRARPRGHRGTESALRPLCRRPRGIRAGCRRLPEPRSPSEEPRCRRRKAAIVRTPKCRRQVRTGSEQVIDTSEGVLRIVTVSNVEPPNSSAVANSHDVSSRPNRSALASRAGGGAVTAPVRLLILDTQV